MTDTEFENNMRGVLFKNDRREKDSQPHYRGSCEVGGVEYWLSAWIKESLRNPGQKFMSLAFTKKDVEPVLVGDAAAQDDIPF